MKKLRAAWRTLTGVGALSLLVFPALPQDGPFRGPQAGPRPGDLAPDIALFDAGGAQRSLRSLLPGHYTAIVLGCLT